MKKFILILSVALAVTIFASSCASYNPNNAQFFTTGTATMAKRGEATNTVWLGMFGDAMTYPLAETVASDNGITRIASVERYLKVGVLGLWVDYTTVVTGE